jgi:hypothetical protein
VRLCEVEDVGASKKRNLVLINYLTVAFGTNSVQHACSSNSYYFARKIYLKDRTERETRIIIIVLCYF